MIAAITQKNNPPKNPSHVFFGEIRSKSLCRPIVDPVQNAPVSFTQINMSTASATCGVVILHNIVSIANGSAIYI